MRGGEGGERHHAACAVTHVPFVDVAGQHAERCGSLHINLLHPAAIDKVVDVGGTPGGRQRVVDVIDGDAQRLRLALVDIDLQLRAVIQAIVTHP